MMFRSADLPKAKTDEERKANIRTQSQHNNDLKNPCLKEQKLSYKCLDENNYDHKACERFFANYNVCKDFWGKVETHRRVHGITPHLPRPEDREEVKKEFLEKIAKGL